MAIEQPGRAADRRSRYFPATGAQKDTLRIVLSQARIEGDPERLDSNVTIVRTFRGSIASIDIRGAAAALRGVAEFVKPKTADESAAEADYNDPVARAIRERALRDYELVSYYDRGAIFRAREAHQRAMDKINRQLPDGANSDWQATFPHAVINPADLRFREWVRSLPEEGREKVIEQLAEAAADRAFGREVEHQPKLNQPPTLLGRIASHLLKIKNISLNR